MTQVKLEPAALRSRVKHSTTEPMDFLLSATLPTELSMLTQTRFGNNIKGDLL